MITIGSLQIYIKQKFKENAVVTDFRIGEIVIDIHIIKSDGSNLIIPILVSAYENWIFKRRMNSIKKILK